MGPDLHGCFEVWTKHKDGDDAAKIDGASEVEVVKESRLIAMDDFCMQSVFKRLLNTFNIQWDKYCQWIGPVNL